MDALPTPNKDDDDSLAYVSFIAVKLLTITVLVELFCVDGVVVAVVVVLVEVVLLVCAVEVAVFVLFTTTAVEASSTLLIAEPKLFLRFSLDIWILTN